MAKYQGIVKDQRGILVDRKTKVYDAYNAAHAAAERLCKRTYGERGIIHTLEIMRKGNWINTPRFLQVKIQEVYPTWDDLYAAGYKEPTHYEGDYVIQGKHIGPDRMQFAAARRK